LVKFITFNIPAGRYECHTPKVVLKVVFFSKYMET
jgi:hypothetical protein